MNKLEKIEKLAEIQHDIRQGVYLNPFKAKEHIEFLLNLIKDLTTTAKKMQDKWEELKK
jgi:hypothetical protein